MKKGDFEERFLEVNGVRLHCVSQGEGPLAILLHGFPEFWYSWRHQLPFLARRFTTVVPDMRGYNTSDKPQGVKAYYMNELMGDVRGLIEAFGQKRATVIGHDWGGVVAWAVAAYYPEMVDRLVIMNAPHPSAYLREIRRSRRQLQSSWYVFMFQVPRLPEWYISRSNFEMLDKLFKGWVYRKGIISDGDVCRFKEAMGQPGCLTAAVNYYRGLFRDPSAFKRVRSYPKIKVPTLIIWGEEDRALTKELTYGLDPYFEAPLEIRYIPRCSHWVQQEQPEEVNRLMGNFLFGQTQPLGSAGAT